jgi:hypothetical protein
MKITKILLDIHDVSGQLDVPKTVGFGVNSRGQYWSIGKLA